MTMGRIKVGRIDPSIRHTTKLSCSANSFERIDWEFFTRLALYLKMDGLFSTLDECTCRYAVGNDRCHNESYTQCFSVRNLR